MFRYLKAAFWTRPEIAGLGRVPLNAAALAGMGILGFGHHGFWLLGIAMETTYLYALSTSPRFRRWIDASQMHVEADSADAQRRALVAKLAPERRLRLEHLEQTCAAIIQLDRDAQTEDFLVEGNRDALQRITWFYLKLLVAQQNLLALESQSNRDEIKRQIAAVQKDLASAKISPSLRESRQATRHILEQRLENVDRREQSLQEIESDLMRIEAQVELAQENAGMRGKSEGISSNIDLVSQLLDDSVYGEAGASIAELDRTFGTVPPAAETQR